MRFSRTVDSPSRLRAAVADPSPAPELAAEVQRAIADQIATGRLQPNERINQERLATELGVSRTPVREALRWLERDGLVRLVARRGAFVAPFDAHDVDEIYELRELLEPRAAGRAAVRATRADVAGLRRLLEAMERAWRSDGTRAFTLNRTFHEALCGPCGNRLLLSVLHQVWSQQSAVRIFMVAQEASEALEERTNAQHRDIVEAFAARDAGQTEALVRSHILEAHEATADLIAGRMARLDEREVG
jgi:DNA-binding GntR family transcriptional regulator